MFSLFFVKKNGFSLIFSRLYVVIMRHRTPIYTCIAKFFLLVRCVSIEKEKNLCLYCSKCWFVRKAKRSICIYDKTEHPLNLLPLANPAFRLFLQYVNVCVFVCLCSTLMFLCVSNMSTFICRDINKTQSLTMWKKAASSNSNIQQYNIASNEKSTRKWDKRHTKYANKMCKKRKSKNIKCNHIMWCAIAIARSLCWSWCLLYLHLCCEQEYVCVLALNYSGIAVGKVEEKNLFSFLPNAFFLLFISI